MSRILALLDDQGRITTDPMQARSARVVLDGGLETTQPIDLRELAGRGQALELSTRVYETQAPRPWGIERGAQSAKKAEPGHPVRREDGFCVRHEDQFERALTPSPMRRSAHDRLENPTFRERQQNLISLRIERRR